MQDLEVSKFVETNQLMNPNLDFSAPYTFYYDETNNIRKFHILNKQAFNYSFHSNFVLGGFLYDKNRPDLDSLIPSLRLQPTITEVKLKYLAKGDFPECLKSSKLNYFLNFILDSSLYAHCSSINLLYYSIVDIVDSAIFESSVKGQLGLGFNLALKNDLYRVCKLEIKQVIDLFYRYQYPNIKPEKVLDFINELTGLFEKYEDEFDFHVGLTSIRQMLKEAKRKNSLPFIMDEEDYVLMQDFSSCYLRPLYIFKNSRHIFDKEDSIINAIRDVKLTYQGSPFVNYEFQDSRSELLIQLSDIFVGLIGKLWAFINSSSPSTIETKIDSFSNIQKGSLDALLGIINRSDQKNPAFFHNVNGLEELNKFGLIFEARGLS